jgi:hypothetical protein
VCSFSKQIATHASFKVCQESWLIAKPVVSHGIKGKLLNRKHNNEK